MVHTDVVSKWHGNGKNTTALLVAGKESGLTINTERTKCTIRSGDQLAGQNHKINTGNRRLHNEELNDLYSSPNIVRVIKSRRMRWGGHVARMGEERGRVGSWWGNRRGRDRWGDIGIGGWIILGWISRRWGVGMWTGLS